MRLDVVASERHYADHLAPIWLGLTPAERGTWHIARSILPHIVERLGIPETAIRQSRADPRSTDPVLAASFQDLRAAKPRPVVMVNHGAGQTYDGTVESAGHPSYSGGRERDRVVLNLCPGPRDLDIVTAAQPHVPAVPVGCPKLDPWHRRNDSITALRRDYLRTVAISFHADIHLCPESRWAYPHFADAIGQLADDDRWHLLGHAHPRAWPKLRRIYAEHGIEPVEHFAEVLDRADIYVVDNSSTAYEFASTGRPVVMLNAPWYRRDVHHGLRFWDLVPGVQVDQPGDLVATVAAELDAPGRSRNFRETATGRVYAAADGHATARAVAAIRHHVLGAAS